MHELLSKFITLKPLYLGGLFYYVLYTIKYTLFSLRSFLFLYLQQQAAATSIYCATANELTGLSGLYFNNCYFCEPSKLSQNEKLQNQLWDVSGDMIKLLREQAGNFVY